MTNYVLAFRGQPDRGPVEGEDEAWGGWFGSMGSTVVDFGHRVAHAKTLRPKDESSPESAVITGYVVINAEDLDAATKVASGCPGLKAGVSVEIAEAIDA